MNNTDKEPNNSKSMVRLPMVIGVSVVAGMLMGATLFGSQARLATVFKNYNKFKEILTLIDNAYVDSVDTDSLVDFSINKMLEKLDPHTSYFNAQEAVIAKAPLQGGYDGIGVEFNIVQDSLVVVAPLAGGPSEEAGIISGDIIVAADSTKLTGKKLNNNLIYTALRGPKGSEVKLSIKRRDQKNLLVFSIKRDRIPSFSVSASYMLEPTVGYIKVDKFTESTMREFRASIALLKNQGMQQLLLDLRGNPGGYMNMATDMVDELLAGNGLIVYTDGRGTANDHKNYAGKPGLFEQGPVVVLIDEGSASASEIVSGSLQDNDRALVVGRRSFGKGLVQKPINLSDGSELRLTISRYYTPSGRCVQRPYVLGHDQNYRKDIEKRLKDGELFSADSIKNNQSQLYKTIGGRTVFGGGGVTPDVFVGRDTSYYSPLLYKVWGKSILRNYAMDYVIKNKTSLQKQSLEGFSKNFQLSETDFKNILAAAKRDGWKESEKDVLASKKFILTQTKAYIARQNWQRKTTDNGYNNEYFKIMLGTDEAVKAAIAQLPKAKLMIK